MLKNELMAPDFKFSVDKFQEDFKCVPSGQSKFQTKNFVLIKETKERTWQQCAWELRTRINNLFSYTKACLDCEIKIEKLERKLFWTFSRKKRAKIKVEIQHELFSLKDTRKTYNDTVSDCNFIKAIMDNPKYAQKPSDQSDFENKEEIYFTAKLENQLEDFNTANKLGYNVGDVRAKRKLHQKIENPIIKQQRMLEEKLASGEIKLINPILGGGNNEVKNGN